MWYKRRSIIVSLGAIFLISLGLFILDHTEHLPAALKNIFNYPLLFGLSLRDLALVGIVWKILLGLVALCLLLKLILRKLLHE